MISEEQIEQLLARKDVRNIHWETDRSWWKHKDPPEVVVEEVYHIWTKRVNSQEELNQRVLDMTALIGVDFEKTHGQGDIILKHKGEGYKIHVWIPLWETDDLTALLSEFYNCEIIRAVHKSPASRFVSYACRIKEGGDKL